MKPSDFPLEKNDRRLTEFSPRTEQRPTVYRYVDSPSPEPAASPGYDSLLDYWHILFRSRKTLLSFALAGLFGAIVISVIQTPIYRVRTSLEIQGTNFMESKSPTDSGGNYGTPESYVETQVKLLQSESLLEHVIDKLKLQQQPPTGLRALTSRARRIFEPSKTSNLREKDDLVQHIERNLTVRTSGNSHLLEVLYESPDPKGAADFANTLVSEFMELTQEERWKSAEGTAEWLTNHLNIMKVQLEQSEAQLQDYARTSGLTFTSEKDNLAENHLKQIQDELSKAQADRIASQAKFEGAKSKPADSLPEILEDSTMREYRQRLTDLQRQYAELTSTLTPEHYEVQRVQAQINELKYQMLIERHNVLVVDRAKPPLLPYRPSLPMNSAIGLFSGVLLGFGFVMLRERIDRRISAPGDAQVYLDLPELGVIPMDEVAVPRQLSAGPQPHRSTPPLPPDSVKKSRLSDCPELATWKRKPSLVAECVRTTLTSILLPSQNGEGPRVIVLTSPGPGDGKTTVAGNLAIAVAESGRKVLLSDGDLRLPRLHKVFGVGNNWGLSDVLWAGTQLENVPILDLVRETEVSGLCVLPGGSRGNTVPSNLFYSPRMLRLLARLRNEFDMVLIDAPPMIHLADARVLGRLADGVILVIRAGQTTTESALFARQRFAEDGTRVLGTVLNSWDPRTASRYGYGSYSDYRAYVAH